MANLSVLPPRSDVRILDSSTLTSKGQITLPKTVRAYLGVSEGQKVQFLEDGGRIIVELQSASPAQDDPAIGAFLDLLARDIATRPGAAAAIPAGLATLMVQLTDGVAVDLADRIDGDVAL